MPSHKPIKRVSALTLTILAGFLWTPLRQRLQPRATGAVKRADETKDTPTGAHRALAHGARRPTGVAGGLAAGSEYVTRTPTLWPGACCIRWAAQRQVTSRRRKRGSHAVQCLGCAPLTRKQRRVEHALERGEQRVARRTQQRLPGQRPDWQPAASARSRLRRRSRIQLSCHAAHLPVRDAAGHDCVEMRHLRLHVKRQTMESDPFRSAHALCSNLAAAHPGASQPLHTLGWRAAAASAPAQVAERHRNRTGQAELGQRADADLFQRPHVPVQVRRVLPVRRERSEHCRNATVSWWLLAARASGPVSGTAPAAPARGTSPRHRAPCGAAEMGGRLGRSAGAPASSPCPACTPARAATPAARLEQLARRRRKGGGAPARVAIPRSERTGPAGVGEEP